MSSDPSTLPSVLPADPEPVEQRLPPTGRKFPCKGCGARLDFDPTQRALHCPYCGYLEKIEPAAKQAEELDFEEYLAKVGKGKSTIEGRSCEVKCTGCGAVVLLEDKVVTDACPYCRTHIENKPVEAESMIQPEGVLPFGVSHRKAIDAFNKWIASRWFAPTGLRQFANLGRLSGIYVPYWTYDSMTYSHYEGQRGDNYWDTETYTTQDSNGNTVTQTRQVLRTNWYYVSGEVQQFFDDILICASRGIPRAEIESLVPWDLKNLEGYRCEFLSGFQTERYGVDLKQGFKRARSIMDEEIEQLCRQDIGGDHQRVSSVQTQHVGVTFKHILLPVWLAAYRYHNKAYRVLVNGRTGRVYGTRPYSWWKIASLIVLGVLALLAVLFIASRAKGAVPKEAPTGRQSIARGVNPWAMSASARGVPTGRQCDAIAPLGLQTCEHAGQALTPLAIDDRPVGAWGRIICNQKKGFQYSCRASSRQAASECSDRATRRAA